MLFIKPVKILAFFLFSFLICDSVSGQQTVEPLLRKLKSAKSDSARLAAYIDINQFYHYYNTDSAYFYVRQGLQTFTESNYAEGIAFAYYLLGSLDANAGEQDAAQKREKKALELFTQINNKRGIASVHNILGMMEGRKGNFDKAAAHFFIALKAYEEIQGTNGIINTYINLGNVYESNGNLDKALDYAHKALALIKDTNEVDNRCKIYNNLAIVYGKKGDLKTSLGYLEKAMAKSDTEANVISYVYSLMNMGIVYSKFGNSERALASLNEGLRLARKKGMVEESVRLLVNIAEVEGEKEPAKGIVELEHALELARQLGNKPMLEDIYMGLAELNKRTGNYKAVASLLENFISYEDSTRGIEKVKAIANLESVYELEQTKSKISELKLQEQAHTLKRNILVTVVLGLALILILTLFYLRRMQHLNKKLLRQEEELKLSNAIKDRVFSIIGHDLRSPIGNVTMILEMLEFKIKNEGDEQLLITLRGQAAASLETLDKLLKWGKFQIKGGTTENVVFNPYEYAEASIKLLKLMADQKQIELRNLVQPEVRISGDPSHFDFIVRNLLSNAIKFTRNNGHIEIGSNALKRPGYVVFSVIDNGVGISDQKLARLFEPFVHRTEGTANESGTGIGLMLCHEFIRENQGEIWVETAKNEGSTFYFTFRLA